MVRNLRLTAKHFAGQFRNSEYPFLPGQCVESALPVKNQHDIASHHQDGVVGRVIGPVETQRVLQVQFLHLVIADLTSDRVGIYYANPPPIPGEDVIPIEDLNTWYYSDAPRKVRPRLDAARRRSTFDEVVGSLEPDNALFEARRCLSCGSCLSCDNCFGVCPDDAVIKLEPSGSYAYAIDLDYCKGCGLCAVECPTGSIEMIPEAI